MKILTRYLVGALLGPFFFALSALTGILFLNAISMEMDKLSGKGLGADVIAQFLVLTLPHTLALTLPMAVLVAVLHAFSEMTASNEITAMKAGGISPRRIMRPLLGMGLLAAATVFVFNDRILPEANHQLKNLLQDINRKSPTFVLREQSVNRIEAGVDGQVYYLIARDIDNQRSTMQRVSVVDSNDPLRSATTFADSAEMAFSADRLDLFLTLYDGIQYQTDENRPGVMTADRFGTRKLAFRGIGNEFERQVSSERQDRELTVAQLLERARERDQRLAELRERSQALTTSATRAALGRPVTDTLVTRTAELSRERAERFSDAPMATVDQLTAEVARWTRSNVPAASLHVAEARGLRVEVHKKWSMAFACIVFVLLGGPLAIRFPRGGLGLVIAASTVIFSIYWVSLIGGEKLANRGFVQPWLVMWFPNVIFLLIGFRLYRRMGFESGTGRGGGWDEVWFSIRRAVGDVLGRTRRRPTGAEG